MEFNNVRFLHIVLSLIFILHFATCRQLRMTHRVVKKASAKIAPSCTVNSKKSEKSHHFSRHPRDTHTSSSPKDFPKSGTAVYFSGRQEGLRLSPREQTASYDSPMQPFTIEMWIKPEGGQENPAIIIALFDACNRGVDKGWSIGISRSAKGEPMGGHLYFTHTNTRITSRQPYKQNQWMHVSSSFDGKDMKLYINGAQVARGQSHNQVLYQSLTAKCKELRLGGILKNRNYFRGSIYNFRLWSYALGHHEVVKFMNDFSEIKSEKQGSLIAADNFHDIKQWRSLFQRVPAIIHSENPLTGYPLMLTTPQCGKTVCDDPDVIKSYTKHWEQRRPKKIRYRIINIMNDDGSDPIISKYQIRKQHQALNRAFTPYNITWSFDLVEMKNSSLRMRNIMYGCDPRNFGNDICDPECQPCESNNDGGDCDMLEQPCRPDEIGDGHCDAGCNRHYHYWDGGDCCLDGSTGSCLDPSSTNRSFISIDEYKRMVNVESRSHLNVHVVPWTSDHLAGVATFPWDKEVFSELGGTLIQPEKFGTESSKLSLVHEVGHNLGLWHVHHGVSEVLGCSDPCMETKSSLQLGDLCSDTTPTPENTNCSNPAPEEFPCGIETQKSRTFANYMGYGDDDCADHFTPQQTARMHCYIDMMYQGWQEHSKPSPVPLPPKIVHASSSSITLAWIPSLGSRKSEIYRYCDDCTTDQALVQFADDVTLLYNSDDGLTTWTVPYKAIGPPDATPCEAGDIDAMHYLGTRSCKNCTMELSLKTPVIPESLTLWVTWEAERGIRNLSLVFEDGSLHSMGSIVTSCSIPYTTRLNLYRPIKAIRISVASIFVVIDAISITSRSNQETCAACKPSKYRISRQPPLPVGYKALVTEPLFVDRNVSKGIRYSYAIRTLISNEISEKSPATEHIHGQPYCGDGLVNRDLSEECDDGNSRDGDGCTLDCEVEQYFHCKGTPSLCYVHDGDGVCEEFELKTSVRDCGFFKPEGFDDQWAIRAVSNQESCLPFGSTDDILGPASPDELFTDKGNSWLPCGIDFNNDGIWIKVYFNTPVYATAIFVHLISAEVTDQDSITGELIGEDNTTRPIGHGVMAVPCTENPLMIHVYHDLSSKLIKTIGVKLHLSSDHFGINAVRLRSSKSLKFMDAKDCAKDELYNPRSQQCMTQSCSRKSCMHYDIMHKHANITCTGASEGDMCKIACHDGYEMLSAMNQAICSDGLWIGPTEIICSPVNCGRPEIVNAEAGCPDGTTFGKVCNFKCIPPARLYGNGREVVCKADSTWSKPTGYCQVLCEEPSTPNAILVTRSCKKYDQYAGSTCKFRCKKGFHMKGMPNKRRVTKYICGQNGQWQGHRCVPISCPAPDPMFRGLYNCTDGFALGSTCSLTCPGGEQARQIITCMMNEEWNRLFSECAFNTHAKCPSLSTMLTNSEVNFVCNNTFVGSRCSVYCSSTKYEVVHITKDVTSPSKTTVVSSLFCTGTKIWIPNPDELICVETCEPTFFDDNFCDAINNRAYCDWDRGACCPSTVVGGTVNPFPTRCTDECACKDPDAMEHVPQQGTKSSSMEPQKDPGYSRKFLGYILP